MRALPSAARIFTLFAMLTPAFLCSEFTMTVAPTAAWDPPIASEHATVTRVLSESEMMLTFSFAVITVPEPMTTFAFVLEMRTPTVPAADASPVGATAAAASTLMSFSRLTALILTLPSVLSIVAPFPIVVLLSASSTTTASVVPTATFAPPPDADSDTSTAVVSVELPISANSFAVTDALLPIVVCDLLSEEITLSAPPRVNCDWALVEIAAATVRTIVLVFCPACMSNPPLVTVTSVPSPIVANTSSLLESAATVSPTPAFDGATERDPDMILTFASSSALMIMPLSFVSPVL